MPQPNLPPRHVPALALAAVLLLGCSARSDTPAAAPDARALSSVPDAAFSGEAASSGDVVVHLFAWTWADVARECEAFLGPAGYAAVQISPPNEHAVLEGRPWYERYQPVSYRLESRSGDRAAFADMVGRCRAAGVDVYADAVLNHMAALDAGTGSGGTAFEHERYPGLYEPADFHACRQVPDRDIHDYQDRWQVQHCQLNNLADLATETDRVRDRLAAYLNDLVGLGVAGFRIDAAKHMPAADIRAVLERVEGRPYVFQEVIAAPGEPILPEEYFSNGDVTEFRVSLGLGHVFGPGRLAEWIERGGLERAWGWIPGDSALVFVDNHDNQRGHGGGGRVVTHRDSARYVLANVLLLATPYGRPRVMSSYAFSDHAQGPPTEPGGGLLPVHAGPVLNCFAGAWQCEHRWPAIANMVAFRRAAAPEPRLTHAWSDGADRIAFGRGDRGFVALNHAGEPLEATLETGLRPGVYCNVVLGSLRDDGAGCTGPSVPVDEAGRAVVSLPPGQALALHVGAQVRP